MLLCCQWTLRPADTAPVTMKERTYGIPLEWHQRDVGCANWLCKSLLKLGTTCDGGTIPHETLGARGICYTQHIYSSFGSPSADMCASASFKQTLSALHVLRHYLQISLLPSNPRKLKAIGGAYILFDQKTSTRSSQNLQKQLFQVCSS